MAAPVKALSVFGPAGLLGTLHATDPLSFSYAASWLRRADAAPLHPAIPLSSETDASGYVAAFFENLLPEGDQRKLISSREQVSTIFGLLAKVGGESAGSVVLLPQGETPQPPVYQPLTWEQVNVLVHGSVSPEAREAVERAAAGLPAPRMSISGAQHKILLYLDEQGAPARPMGSSPSTHILKPDIVRPDINAFASAANETIMMLAAARCGLPTAQVTYRPEVQACLVQRYDRRRREDGTVERIWQADFCQLLGLQSDVKYEHDGGPAFHDCYELLGQSAQPGVDRRTLLRWLFFNLYTGNNDSHAKNLSMLADGRRMRLAPFYDLMCTRVYPGLGPRFAFSIAGESDPGQLTRAHFVDLAGALGVAPRYLLKLAKEMAETVEAALPAAAEQVLPLLAPGQVVLTERIMQKVGSITRRMAARITSDGGH